VIWSCTSDESEKGTTRDGSLSGEPTDVRSVRRDARILSPASAHGLSSGEVNRCIDADNKAVGDELLGLRSPEPCHSFCIGGDTQTTPTPVHRQIKLGRTEVCLFHPEDLEDKKERKEHMRIPLSLIPLNIGKRMR